MWEGWWDFYVVDNFGSGVYIDNIGGSLGND